MNDGLQTNVFLRFKAEAIASACIHLALLQLAINMPPMWWEVFGATLDDVQEIAFVFGSFFPALIVSARRFWLCTHARRLTLRLCWLK
jgi:hypothetical protein